MLRPGQFYTINNVVYRVKRKTCGCTGCAFARNPFCCPGIVTKSNPQPRINCLYDNIILVRI